LHWLNGIKTRFLATTEQEFVVQSVLYVRGNILIVKEGELMKRLALIIGLIGALFSTTGVAEAQQQVTPGSQDTRRITRVLVSGDAVVKAQPDTAILMISVVTQAKQALEAQQQNAVKSEAVIRAIKAAVSTAEVKTSGYSLQPQRVYRENQPPTISGYEARNTVTVTLSDLTKVGTVIDTSSQAGANDISSIAFTLKQDRPARDQALKDATREAISKAQVIAQALGGRVVRIAEVQEEGFRPPQPIYQTEAFMTKQRDVATPIEIGALEITSRVQLIAEVENNL
jgi:uncharacterized protein